MRVESQVLFDIKSFRDWLQTMLTSVDYDIADLKRPALVPYETAVMSVLHENPPT